MTASFKTAVAAAIFATLIAGAPAFAAGSGSGPAPSSAPADAPRRTVDTQRSFAEGVAALQASDYKKAEKKFAEVLSASPDNPEANYYEGLAKTKLGKDKQSIRYFERAIKLRPEFTEAREQLALAQIRLQNPAAAQEQLAKIKENMAACTPQTCDQAYTDRGAKAVAKVEAALAAPPAAPAPTKGADLGSGERFGYLLLEPESQGLGRYREGVKFVNENKFAQAYAAFSDSARAIGPHPDILNYLGYTSRKQGKFDDAKRFYAQALKLDPNHKGATEYLGELYLELGDVASARRQLAKLDLICTFGCAEREDLARLIDVKDSARSASN